MRKTQDRMRLAHPYVEKARTVMNHLAQANADHDAKSLELHHGVHRVGSILTTSDKGLYDSLNADALKKFLAQVQGHQEQGIEVEVMCLDSKSLAACQNTGLNIIAGVTDLGDTSKMEALLGPLIEIFQCYKKHGLDRIHMVYSRFINTMCQEPRTEVLLPIGEDVTDDETGHSSFAWEYLYELSPIAVSEYLAHCYLEFVVYQALSDNMTLGRAARMVAMKAATDNAGNTIKELRLVYSKSRQAAVTTELSEAIAGTATV